MIRVRTLDEYIDWVKQTTYDAEDLRAYSDYDKEFTGDALVFLDPLEYKIKKLYEELINGKYKFSSEPLSFMGTVEKNDPTLLPFKHLLQRINATHTQDLDQKLLNSYENNGVISYEN